ncbi:MAG: peroxidase family protein, partial [Acidobacteriota bacterium]
TGKLKTSAGDLLPFNVDGLPNAGGPAPTLFLAGDVRANEQIGLTAMHTLWVREHNRQAERIAQDDSRLSGEEIYQRARRRVGALMQVITYREFLPALLGPSALRPYDGYKPNVDGAIANLFSTAAYRFGHSTLSTTILRVDEGYQEITDGHLELRDAFFSPHRLADEGGLEPILRGLAAQICQAVDPYVVDDLRNFLFGPPGAGGFDLVSLNIQRGRDHGLPSYNTVRGAFGRSAAKTFADITSDPALQARLAEVYDHPDDVDLWVGGLAEDPVRNGLVGPLWRAVLAEQFEALRDGDRFWYERTFSGGELRDLQSTRLSDVVRRNTTIGRELQDDVFHLPSQGGSVVFSDSFEDLSMSGWSLVVE